MSLGQKLPCPCVAPLGVSKHWNCLSILYPVFTMPEAKEPSQALAGEDGVPQPLYSTKKKNCDLVHGLRGEASTSLLELPRHQIHCELQYLIFFFSAP